VPVESTNEVKDEHLPPRNCPLLSLQIVARCILLILPVSLYGAASQAQSHWVYPSQDGKLIYTRTARGDRIPDFSSAGYRGGGAVLLFVQVRVKVSPSGGADDTPQIQAALDKVARMAPDARGERGAVQLAPGHYHLVGTLAIHVSGVVLRGTDAIGPNASELDLTGAPHLAISIQGDFHQRTLAPPTWLADRYVPAGATTIHVVDASAIHASDWLEIVKPGTPAWTHFMGMDHLARNGKPET
jgi:hypothetical protein